MLFYNGRNHIYKSSLCQCTESVGHRVLAKLPRRENELKNKKNLLYICKNHFEASQCPEVVGSAQDGERATGVEAISGQGPGSRPMRGRVENAQESENLQKSVKNGFENYENL